MARTRGSRVKYDKLVPPDTFLHTYLKYMSVLETPYSYDFWTALWLMSIVIGRGIKVNRPMAPIYLNLFCILVADSGVTRKSTAVRIATEFARPFCDPYPMLIESKITPEMLEHRLHKQAQDNDTGYAAISVSELVTFLGREKYNEQMPTLLTDLYDAPEMRTGGGTLSTGARTFKNVFVSFLSASTPAWLLRAVNPDVIEGGFTSRVVFICSEEPKQLKSWPEAQDEQLSSDITDLLKGIREFAASRSTIEVSDGARKAFDRWYRSRPRNRDPFRSSFQSREDAHILRLAAFLCINDNTWVIQHTHVVSAIKIITEVREDGANLFEGTGSTSKAVLGIDKIRDKLLAAGTSGLPQKEITKAVAPYMDATHMKAVLDIMHDLQMVQKFENIQVGKGRPSTLWRATRALVDTKAVTKIIEDYHP